MSAAAASFRDRGRATESSSAEAWRARLHSVAAQQALLWIESRVAEGGPRSTLGRIIVMTLTHVVALTPGEAAEGRRARRAIPLDKITRVERLHTEAVLP